MVHFNWDSLDDDEFEELCTELMRRKGFQNVRRMSGPGAGDQGRDIHAEEDLTSASGSVIQTRILAQCKNYYGSRTTIGPGDVETLAQRARTLRYNRILIITSYDLSSAAKTTALDMATNPAWSIIADWWSVHDLTNFLIRFPDLKRRFTLETVAPPQLEIAILDGYASNRITEKPCTPTFSHINLKDWETLIASDDTNTSFISASEIDTCYDAIINPFGETFPEEDWPARRTYERILNYINNGGLFVNVAGYPFFYYWDHIQGSSIPTGRAKSYLNPANRSIVQVIHFDDTPLYADFGILLDSNSPRPVTIFQQEEDRHFVGNLLNLNINPVTEFRAALAGNPNVVPIVRAEGLEVYPLSAVRLGNGHLLISGLELHEAEAPLIVQATRNWLLTAGGILPLQTT